MSLKKGQGEFDSDLFNRNLEKTFVFKEGKEMEEQMMKEAQKQNKVEEVVEEKVEEVVEEKLEEVSKVDEQKAEEKTQSKGIFSKIKNIFKRK